jgi:hypothetical protein
MTKKEIAILTREFIVNEIAPDNFRDDLCCACAIASWTLWKAFKKKGYKAILVEGNFLLNCHFWVELDNMIYDITYSQFCGKTLINIIDADLAKSKGYSILHSGKKAVQALNTDWPGEQHPSSHRAEIRVFLNNL